MNEHGTQSMYVDSSQSRENLFKAAMSELSKGNLSTAEMILKRCHDIDPFDQMICQQLFDVYQANIEALRKSPYVNYPLLVSIETLALCNAKCSFCPYPTMERLGTKMPDNLISKIIQDLKDIPSTIPFRFAPFKVSDPFLDSRLFKIIKKVNDELPNARIDIYSNGSAISLDKLEMLCTIKNIDYLNISINDHRKENYENLMKLPFDHIIRRLEAIHHKLATDGLPFPVVISRVCDYKTDEEFRGWMSAKFPLFHVHTHRRSDWLGQVNVSGQNPPNIGCIMWFSLSIMANGIAAYCCMDGIGQFPIGDTRVNHVLDIYNSSEFRLVRETCQSRLDASPCGQCNFF